MSFAAGFGAGIGAGIAIGIPSGTKQARDKLGRYFEDQEITLLDHQGNQIAVDDVLDHALKCGDTASRKLVITLLVLGVLAVAAAVVYLVNLG